MERKSLLSLVAFVVFSVVGITSCSDDDPTPISTHGQCVSGIFSVSPTKKVQFAKGNLYCTKNEYGTYSFAFEKKQCDYHLRPGHPAIINGCRCSNPDGTSGRFAWNMEEALPGGSYGAFCEERSIGKQIKGTVEDVMNWGKTIGSDWSVLTKEEAEYLFDKHSSRESYICIGGCCYENGVLVYPDGYAGDMKETSLDEIDATGILFLPKDIQGENGNANINYWTCSPGSDSTAIFCLGNISSNYARFCNLAVRLVKQVK